MSMVTNVMVSVSNSERAEVIAKLGKPIRPETGITHQTLQQISYGDYWGGYKAPECTVWAAAFNYVTTDEVLAFVAAIPWKYPADVQVFINEQDDDRFHVYQFVEGEELEQMI